MYYGAHAKIRTQLAEADSFRLQCRTWESIPSHQICPTYHVGPGIVLPGPCQQASLSLGPS